MKQISMLIVAFAVAATVNAQDPYTMYVMKDGGILYQEFVSEIDSIIFYEPGTPPEDDPTTMYVMKNGGILHQESVADIDSIIFYDPNPAPDTYTIVATAGTGGNISPNGTVIVNPGDNQTFTFTPNEPCYEIDQVIVDGTPVSISDNSYTFNNVMADHTIHVTFTGEPPSSDDYVEIAGIKWAKYNLGVGGIFETNITDLGALYQWGRKADGHESRTSGTSLGPGVSELDEDGQVPTTHPAYGKFITWAGWPPQENNTLWNATGDDSNPKKSNADPCPCGWRVPTATEIEALVAATATEGYGSTCGGDWVSINGVWGRQVGIGSNTLFFPAPGQRSQPNGILLDPSTYGYYWSSTIYNSMPGVLMITNGSSNCFARAWNSSSSVGNPIRCVVDE